MQEIEGAAVIIPGRLRALVVDDNTYARAICGASLKKLGVTDITEADNGAEAILALMTAPFDFMVMDWYMPDISGAGLMRVLRDIRFGAPSNTPVILMTGYASRDNVALARELGVNEVLVKPFTTTQLGIAVGRVLGQSQQAGGDDAVFL
ncbi:response regulator [Devosia sp. BSSL-BM10]|uniref:Response regulator n=1 Tax=Devosia litorisediminis TaxID=2829817 RepID=A0A942E8E4_9HYPH|nr:response regulator [Devosia litorisediminis]MBS3849446.1 response regulator [Devosia litorisediminis]